MKQYNIIKKGNDKVTETSSFRPNKIIVVFPVTRPSLENHADPTSFYS